MRAPVRCNRYKEKPWNRQMHMKVIKNLDMKFANRCKPGQYLHGITTCISTRVKFIYICMNKQHLHCCNFPAIYGVVIQLKNNALCRPLKTQTTSKSTSPIRPSFLNIILGQITFHSGDLPQVLQMFCNIPALYPLDSNSNPQVMTTKNVCRNCQIPLGDKITPGEDAGLNNVQHSIKRTSVNSLLISKSSIMFPDRMRPRKVKYLGQDCINTRQWNGLQNHF